MQKCESVHDYLNRALFEAEILNAKEKDIPLSIVKFKYDVDLDNAFFFKSLMQEMYTLFLFSNIYYDNKNGFIVLLKNKRLHESVTLYKKIQNRIYNEHGVRIDRAGITTLSKDDTVDDILKRVNRYFVISKRLQIGKVIYGTKEFDFFNDKKREDSFQTIIKENPKIKIYNLYEGIPISEEGIIVEFNPQMICLKTSYEELLYLSKNEEFLFIKHKEFPNIIKGEIFQFNFEKQLVCIKNIEFQDVSVIDRENIRIKPPKKIHTMIEYQNSLVANGEINSISVDSISIKVDKNSIRRLRALETSEFILKFRLFVKNSIAIDNISIRAKIFKIIGDEIIFIITPNSFMKSKIENYVATIKKDIIKTLKQKIIIK